MRNRRGGFTLVEVMISMGIFAGTMGAFAGYYAATAQLKEAGRNLTQAMTDARTVLEGIRSATQTSAGVWQTGVTTAFPEGASIAPPTGLLGLGAPWTLTSEVVTVSYADPATGVSVLLPPPDPLPVTVTVTWSDRGRPRSVLLRTLMTRRS